jgi:syntaxin 7
MQHVKSTSTREQEEAQLEAQRIAEERRTKFQQLEQQREIERALIEERDKGIRDIEASVVTVNEIFQDLATLVEEQGEMIGACALVLKRLVISQSRATENIESNIQKTDVNTKEGVAELRKANSYQKSSRTKLCILLLCIVLLCGAVAGGYFLFKPKE